ncbi:MAG: peptidase [Bacteroidales bacterium]|nr:peptidase [Bacteroidales bacterium]
MKIISINIKYFLWLLLSIILLSSCKNTSTTNENISLKEKLDKLKGAKSSTEQAEEKYKQVYKLMIEQPLDHNHPDGEKFLQKVYISHLDVDKPVVLSINGYSANKNRISELAKLLDANQVYVEHRFFGDSKPGNYDWNYLNMEQASADYHHIVALLKTIYHGKWISTGISKGGQTTIFYRYYYPKDVSASVPYVAPLNFSAQEPRVIDFLKKVGTKECRDKILAFQKMFLANRDILMPAFKKNAELKGYTFHLLGGIDKAYEYSILEYSFAFWQWQFVTCNEIPSRIDDPDKIMEHMNKVDCISFFSDESVNYFRPFFYQGLTEIGMYTYDTEPFGDLIKYAHNPNFKFTMPKGFENAPFNEKLMRSINKWLQNDSKNFVFIYGENDPWYSTGVRLIKGKTNNLLMIKKEGSHRTRIKSFTIDEQKQILDSLNRWIKQD